MNEKNQELYEIIVNIANHAPECEMMINFFRGKPALDTQCTCWKKRAIELIESIDKELADATN